MDVNIKAAKNVELLDETPSGQRFALKLLRHWTPADEEDVVILGWKKPAVMLRAATGGNYEAEPERFIKDEIAPAPVVGASVGNSYSEQNIAAKGAPAQWVRQDWIKIWKGTYVEVSAETAYALNDQKIGQMVAPPK